MLHFTLVSPQFSALINFLCTECILADKSLTIIGRWREKGWRVAKEAVRVVDWWWRRPIFEELIQMFRL